MRLYRRSAILVIVTLTSTFMFAVSCSRPSTKHVFAAFLFPLFFRALYSDVCTRNEQQHGSREISATTLLGIHTVTPSLPYVFNPATTYGRRLESMDCIERRDFFSKLTPLTGFQGSQNKPSSASVCTLSDYQLFTELKEFLGRRRFSCDEQVKVTVEKWLQEVKQKVFDEVR